MAVFRYLRLNALVDTIEKRQIYWEEGDDPMLIAYQSYFETDGLSRAARYAAPLSSCSREDVENYYTLANLMLSHYDKYSKLVSQGPTTGCIPRMRITADLAWLSLRLNRLYAW